MERNIFHGKTNDFGRFRYFPIQNTGTYTVNYCIRNLECTAVLNGRIRRTGNFVCGKCTAFDNNMTGLAVKVECTAVLCIVCLAENDLKPTLYLG